MRDTGQTPGRRALGDIGPLLKVINLTKAGLDDGILLNVLDLSYVNT